MEAHHDYRVLDSISAVAIVATFAGFLPPIAAGLAIIWYCIQIYESKSFQQFLARFKRKSG